MKSLLVTLGILILQLHLVCAQEFFKTISKDSISFDLWDIQEIPNSNNYLLAGINNWNYSGSISSGYVTPLVIKLDSAGNPLIIKNLYISSDPIYLTKIVKINADSTLLLGVKYFEEIPDNILYLIWIDNQTLSVKDYKSYQLPFLFAYANASCITNNNDILLYGTGRRYFPDTTISNNYDIFILKTNAALDSLALYTYNKNLDQYSIDIFEWPTPGSYILNVYGWPKDTVSPLHSPASVVFLDSIFNVTRYFEIRTLLYASAMLPLTNSIFYMGTQTFNRLPGEDWQISLSKYNLQGQVICSLAYGKKKLRELTSTNALSSKYPNLIYLGGTTFDDTDTSSILPAIVMALADSNCNLIWERQFSSDDTTESFFIRRVLATSDSGVIVIGQKISSNRGYSGFTDLFVLKLRNNLLLTDITHPENITLNANLKPFPNPATHTLQLPPNTEIILYNTQGAIVLKSAETHISIAHLPRGVYGYRLVSSTRIHTTTGKIILE